jgi:hypothetical protein
MDKSYDKIGEALNVETQIVKNPEVISNIEKPTSSEDAQKDYEYSRAQLYSLVEKGQEAVNGILDVAASSDHPRAYEVAGQLIKNVADVADKLADLHKKMKDINDTYKGPQSVTNNALYVGSTADLLKLIKDGKKNVEG